MYKHAKSRRRPGDAPESYHRYAIITMRVGRDNMQRAKVYRQLRTWPSMGAQAQAWWARMQHYAFYAWLDYGRVISWGGNPWLVRRWHHERRGLNRGVDWRSGTHYMHRELSSPVDNYWQERGPQ